ncbi:MAG: nickel pincer cofactor biosynthesis protein LarB [Bradymonadia bacterium]
MKDEHATDTSLPFATLDLDRLKRRGMPEVILGTGKTPTQIAEIARRFDAAGQRVLATRVTPEAAAEVMQLIEDLPAEYDAISRCLTVQRSPAPAVGLGTILVVSAGTGDGPVAAEAIACARFWGHTVDEIHDVGIAGLHRILGHVERLRRASVIIVCAGMDGALPGVVGGLVDRPVIAVPTEVGYGASFNGVAALLTMLNSCAAGVTVVNIGNGFGAAYAAAQINTAPRTEEPR